VLKQAKREARLAARRAKKKNITAKTSSESVMHDILKPITLEDLTNPDNKK
jgi:predicted nucleic acid binding AN1-type Zn finger protein